jgi:hypothetical protein
MALTAGRSSDNSFIINMPFCLTTPVSGVRRTCRQSQSRGLQSSSSGYFFKAPETRGSGQWAVGRAARLRAGLSQRWGCVGRQMFWACGADGGGALAEQGEAGSRKWPWPPPALPYQWHCQCGSVSPGCPAYSTRRIWPLSSCHSRRRKSAAEIISRRAKKGGQRRSENRGSMRWHATEGTFAGRSSGDICLSHIEGSAGSWFTDLDPTDRDGDGTTALSASAARKLRACVSVH